jgi:cytoskeletal protein CcmA (bactofilin family)
MITGDVVCSGDLRIDGNIKGNVRSKAKVIIGQSGIIDGDINCKSIEIEGNVKANVTVTDLMSLKSTANLVGNICAGKLAIEPGANFAGNCRMQGMKADVHPTTPANDNNNK